jgi:type II secretory pathway pseudopilin PulG
MGRLRRRRGTGGYILLDVLVAMAIAVVGLAVFLASLSGVVRTVSMQRHRILRVIEQRNADAKDQTLFFQGK